MSETKTEGAEKAPKAPKAEPKGPKIDPGPKRNEAGAYLPSTYVTASGIVRTDR